MGALFRSVHGTLEERSEMRLDGGAMKGIQRERYSVRAVCGASSPMRGRCVLFGRWAVSTCASGAFPLLDRSSKWVMQRPSCRPPAAAGRWRLPLLQHTRVPLPRCCPPPPASQRTGRLPKCHRYASRAAATACMPVKPAPVRHRRGCCAWRSAGRSRVCRNGQYLQAVG